MNNKKLYARVTDKWGDCAQVTKAIEELSELIKELCKDQIDCGDLDNIAEEVADVEIMCEQLRYIYDLDKSVDFWKKYKLERLEKRVNN